MSVREARRLLIAAGHGATLSAAAKAPPGSWSGAGATEQLEHLAEIAAYIGETDPLMIGAAFLLEQMGYERSCEQLRLEVGDGDDGRPARPMAGPRRSGPRSDNQGGGHTLDTQEKFTAALRERARERGLELIVERTYADSGFYSLQPPGSFCPVLRLPFAFRTGHSSFDGGVGEPGPLGLRADGTPWSGVRGGEHDEVLDRVAEILDAGVAAHD